MKVGHLVLSGTGLIFVWSAISGASVTGTVRDVISGRQPHGGTNAILASTGGDSGTSGGGASGVPVSNSAIANQAIAWNGQPYVWGGGDPPRGSDCSGFCNGICRKLGISIPGSRNGQYSGHGPVTGQWYEWNGCVTVPDSQMQAGDFVVWPTHMGVVVKPGWMISALNSNMGTRLTPIKGYGPLGEPHKIRRHK